MKRFAAVVLPPTVSLVLFLGLFELVARGWFADASYLLPAPSAILRVAVAERALLGAALIATAKTTLLGFLLSAVVGVAAAVALSSSRLLERALYPYAIALQTVPIVAIAPLLVVWLGVGPRSVVASAFIVSVFPVVTNALAGIRGVDPALRDLFRLYGASRAAVLWKLELPHATPSLATGLRIASGLAVIGAIVGEFVAGFAGRDPGLGIVVMTSYRQLRTDLLFAAVGCSSLLGIVLFSLVSAVAQLVFRRWYVGVR